MSDLLPYTREELDAMPDKLVIELYKTKSPRLHPFCLIGLPISEVREKMREWFKGRCQTEILIAGKEASFGDTRVLTWFCNVDENNIMIDIWDGNKK